SQVRTANRPIAHEAGRVHPRDRPRTYETATMGRQEKAPCRPCLFCWPGVPLRQQPGRLTARGWLMHAGNILVVDDEPVVLQMLGLALRHHGFNVWLANGGAEAVRLYEQHRDEIDVVLLD